MALKGNLSALKHGGDGALTAIHDGRELTGPAADSEAIVRAELETQGRAEIVTKAAVRLEAVARLFYAAFVEAATAGNLDKMDTYVKRYGWLQTSALRAWQQVKTEQGNGKNVLDYEQMTGGDNGKDD